MATGCLVNVRGEPNDRATSHTAYRRCGRPAPTCHGRSVMNRKRSITVVEHDPMLGMLLQEVLSDEGYVTELWIECEGALECIRRTQPDLVILDLWLRRRGD